MVCEPVFLEATENPVVNVRSLLEYTAYAVATKKLQAQTVESHLSAIKFFHRSSRGFELNTAHPLLRNALKGSARSHAVAGSQPRVRRPVSWPMLLAGEYLAQTWGVGGRVLWLALGASFFFLTRAAEMFAETSTRMHEIYGLRRGGVAFFRGGRQLEWGQWPTADRVEVRFRGSKGDQLRKGAVLTRARKGPPRPVGDGGGAVDLMIELLSCYLFLPPSAPLVAFGCGSGRWSMWTQTQATKALRQVVSVAGMQAEEYALHSLRIGGATHLSAGGAAPEVLKREGRWTSGAYKGYVRNHGRDAQWVSGVMVDRSEGCKKQPGQGTKWGVV